MPSTGFFVGTCFAALAIVVGSCVVFIEFRDHTAHYLEPVLGVVLGVAMLILVFLAERPQSRKLIRAIRNSVLVLFGVVLVIALFLILVGPLH